MALWWARPLGVNALGAGLATALMVGAPIGALCGLITAPALGLTVLRGIPVWMGVTCTTITTLIGGSIGLLHSLWFALDVMGPDPVRGALAGLAIGALTARLIAHYGAPRDG